MANIDKVEAFNNVRIDIHNSAYLLIDNYLPEYYSEEALKMCLERKIEADVELIQSVKNRRAKKSKVFNEVLDVLVEIANQNKSILENIKQKIG